MKKFILMVIAISLLSGCATYKKSMPFPKSKESMKVQIDTGMPSKGSQPIGTYIDQKNRLVVTGHQKGIMAGLLFGPIGVFTVDAVARSSGKKQYSKPVSHLNADWIALSTNILTGLIQENPPTAKLGFCSGTQQLMLRPYGVLNVHNQTSTVLFLVLEATLSNREGEVLWEARYFVPTEHSYSLTSTQGWVNPDVYQSELKSALKTAYQTLLRQIDNKPVKGNEIVVKLTTSYTTESFPIRGHIVGEQNDYVFFQAKLMDAAPCAGCYILKKKDMRLAGKQ